MCLDRSIIKLSIVFHREPHSKEVQSSHILKIDSGPSLPLPFPMGNILIAELLVLNCMTSHFVLFLWLCIILLLKATCSFQHNIPLFYHKRSSVFCQHYLNSCPKVTDKNTKWDLLQNQFFRNSFRKLGPSTSLINTAICGILLRHCTHFMIPLIVSVLYRPIKCFIDATATIPCQETQFFKNTTGQNKENLFRPPVCCIWGRFILSSSHSAPIRVAVLSGNC